MTSETNTLRIALPTGVELDIARTGNPAGPTMVLLPGVTDSHRAFAPFIAELPHGLDIIAVSPRGHGDSSKPQDGYRIDDFVADLAALYDQLGIERAIVLGHSMGSLVAQRFAIDHPARVRALVLIGAFPTVKENAEVAAFYEAELKDLADPIDPALVHAFQDSTLFRAVPDSFLDQVVSESRKVPARVWRAAFRAMLTDDFSSDLGSIVCPTFILWGDEDAITSRDNQLTLRRRIPDARLSVLEAVGHAPHWEIPGRAAREVVAFLAALPATRPAHAA